MLMYSEIIFSVSGLDTLYVRVRVVSLSGLRLSRLCPVQGISWPCCVLSRLRPSPGCVYPGCVCPVCALSALCLSRLCPSTYASLFAHGSI